MVLIAPDSAAHLSEMLTLPPRTLLSLIASERRDARSAINTIQAEHSVVEYDDIRKAEDVLVHDLSFRLLLRP
jgi:DNA polymerase III delta prime subunit